MTRTIDLDLAAASWQVRRQDGLSASEEAQFQAWLDADTAHSQAYARMQHVWSGLGELHPTAVAQLAKAMPARKKPAFAWQGLASAALAICVMGAGWLGWDHVQQQPVFHQSFASARGELLDVHLPDGSVLKLDTATRVEVTLYRQRREVRLPEGQANFYVRADKERPFDVLTDSLRVTVVGTRFAVRNTHAGLGLAGETVTVEDGRVRVAPLHATGGAGAMELTAGESVQANRTGALGTVDTRLAHGALLWREGRINFDNTPLAQAVAEFERYGDTSLLIKDAEVAAMRVNGSFDTRLAADFGSALPQVLPVQLRKHGNVTEIIAQRRAAK
ncbi:FecR family protein [Janthinobacterium psychrotolerans]|uniref:Transmembrane sensor n=1 Tax=Janthinobacterium psychrotolerans TaxID=1747903 RepID=A0A1A7BYV0_9BURK|nr:FecR domain-containing protein [Janthinobacterium psychrotolerans]OBV38707.1 transmembrane sensor [Janthinobacterium psychrotolerans]